MFEELGKITKVSYSKDNTYVYVDTDNGWCFGYENIYEPKPQIGDMIKTFCTNGSLIHGIELNGTLLYYKSDEQLELEHKEMVRKMSEEKLKTFEKNKVQMDKDYNELPEYFQKRIDGFREKGPNFRVDSEEYEVFCCKEATKIANTLKTVEEIERFQQLTWSEQKELVDIDVGHSGNTFYGSCYLAKCYLMFGIN
jgi:hypothetical protein